MKATFLSVVAVLCSVIHASPLQKRVENDISSCGPEWMPIDDISTNHGQIKRRGFNSAVDFFCDQAHGQTIGGNLYLSLATRAFLSFGKNPTEHGNNGYVYFEIHNKLDEDHIVDGEKCKEYLKALSKEGGRCYGAGNKDTKGGTWQVGNEDISYHALAEHLPPTFDAVDKTIVLRTKIEPLGLNYKVPVPFPYYSFNDVVPVGCHSHNDYDRDFALYSALSAGCVSAEVDVWNDDLKIGHISPGRATITDFYIDPLKTLLEGVGTVFPAEPDQDFSLLVDFKTSGTGDTWQALIDALAPLRDRGWLSHFDGEFKKGKVTVIVSGKASFDLVNNDSTNPGRYIFSDAILHGSLDDRDSSNTYLASADFSDAVGGSGTITGSHLENLRSQVKAAHNKEFKVRYWNGPSKDQWQQLVDECVDRINVDDPSEVASLDWKLDGGSCVL